MRALATLLLALAGPAYGGDDFWKHWGDGKAELSGYALTQPRYGALREGTAVLIFVTEDFTDAARVKAERPHPGETVYPVLKLNFVRSFQTGVYDYHVMTSTFVRADPPMALVKTSFSAQEWCGHVHAQWMPRGRELVGASHSYFDGEADQAPRLPIPDGGVLEEEIPIHARGLRGDWITPGGSRHVMLLPSALRSRFAHRPQAWIRATVRRSHGAAPVRTALGALRAYTITVEEKDGPTTTWTIEEAWPRRLLAWRSSDGDAGRILGSARLPYWQLHDLGHESYLEQLGLSPPPPRKK